MAIGQGRQHQEYNTTYRVIQLKDKQVHMRYNVELRNRSEALETIEEVLNKTAETVTGKCRGTKRQAGVSPPMRGGY